MSVKKDMFTFKLAEQFMTALKSLHDHGFVMVDVEPRHFNIASNEHNACWIDFGEVLRVGESCGSKRAGNFSV